MTGSNVLAATKTQGTTLAPQEEILLAPHLDHLKRIWGDALSANKMDGVWIAAGNSSTYFQDDHGPAFKPNPYFSQWVEPKFAQPGAHLLIRPGHDNEAILFTLAPTDYWHAVAPSPDYLSPHVDIRAFDTEETLAAAAAKESAASQAMAYIGEDSSNEFTGQLNPPALQNCIDFHRAVKTEYELELMRRASEIGAVGHLAAEQEFMNGGTEFDIHLAYLAASMQNEWDLPYANIVALNEHAATLHYQLQDRIHSSPAKSLLIDAGGQHRGYASDITRTYASRGDAHQTFSALIDAMREHQNRILAKITVGQTYAELHQFMHESLCQVLADAEIINCSAEQAFELAINEAFCPHGLGHLLGIQVHDVGGHLMDATGTLAPPTENYPALRFTRRIEPDQVFTIEPGLYFIESLLANEKALNKPINWNLVEHLCTYGGIRIEDNVRVLTQGHENLTRDAWLRVAPQ